MAFIFPIHRFNPVTVKPTRARRIISGGVALSGEEAVIETDGGGMWVWQFSGIALRGPELLRLWSAWDVELAGGAAECWVPIPSIVTAPRPFSKIASALVANDPSFPTSLAYPSPVMLAGTIGDVALRGTTIQINIAQGQRIQGGEMFSVDHPKGPGLYTIGRVISRNGMRATCTMWPPARAAIPQGTPVNFDIPMMRGKLQPGYDMAAQIEAGRYATAEIVFVEATA